MGSGLDSAEAAAAPLLCGVEKRPRPAHLSVQRVEQEKQIADDQIDNFRSLLSR